MLLGEILNGDDAKVSNRERIALGPDLNTDLMSDVTDNYSLRDEKRLFS